MRDIDARVPSKRIAWLAVLTVCGVAAAQTPVSSAFGPGEQTTYAVKYLGLTAGVAQVTVGWKMEQFDREVWPLVCVGKTSDAAAVFPVNDRFVSYWDPVTREAVGSDFVADENKQRRRERYRYDFAAKEAIATKQSAGEKPREARYAIEPGTVDLASAAFRLRNEKLEAGRFYEMNIFTGVKTYKLKASVLGKETISTALGRLEVLRVTVNGDFNDKLATRGLMTLFYTADDKQLPVRAEAEFVLGKVVLEVVKYEPGMRFAGGL